MSAATGAGATAGPLGLLGGTFDPVHQGHIALAAAAQSAAGLAEVAFVPAGDPWQRSGSASPAELRTRLLALALADHPGWHIDARELERGGPTYTVDTLAAVRAQCGPARSLVWILGYDQICRLDTWHRWEELTDLAHLAYARRAGAGEPGGRVATLLAAHRCDARDLAARAAGGIAEFPMEPVPCSSTAIRAALAAGDVEAARRYLAPRVFDHVLSLHLYGTHGH